MSDFSSGFFMLSENKEKVPPYLARNEWFIQLNEKWIGKLSPMDTSTEYQPQTLALSKEVPLLHLIHAEEHGFLIRILHERDVKFHFDISYDIGVELYTEIGNELYGDHWWRDVKTRDERNQRTREEWSKRLENQGMLDAFFSNLNLEKLETFQLFGVNKENLLKASKILTIKNCAKDSLGMVYDLLDCLGLKEFYFVAHHYVSKLGSAKFTVLNHKL